MIEKVIEYSIRNRFIVLVLAAALSVWGIYAVLHTPVDAVPDLSENQVIIFTDWMGRSPSEIEEQVTYPLALKLQGLAGIKAVRSSSEFNFSMITLIFEDNIDFYFARQRVMEKLGQAGNFLPRGVVPYMAPDATALGQIFWYTVEPSPENPQDPGRLWALNKFTIAPQLNAAPGVAEVATVGGAPLEYQIDVRPEALRAYSITLGDLYAAVAGSNLAVGGGVIQKNNAEYLVRSVGWIKDQKDIDNTVVKEVNRTPIYVKNLATVQLGTQFRRSIYEKNGNEVVGGVVLMRHGENPLAVTARIKEKIQEVQPGLPKGVRIVPAYDRTRLITGAIHTLTEVMWHEMVIASVAVLLILMHLRSVFVICVTLPLSVLFSFLLMWLLRRLGIIDIQANIMSLAGITISIGILVDQAIVMTENATHHLKAHFGDRKVAGDIREMVIPACRTVGRPIFFSVMIMLVSFIPVFMLSGREGKYVHPLAFTKSFALIGVAIISVTVVPALIPTFIKGRLRSEEENWIVRSFIRIYKPLLTWALPRRNLVMWMFAALLILAAGFFPLQVFVGLGSWAWKPLFLIGFAIVASLTVIFTHGLFSRSLSLASLVLLGLWAFHFPKIGGEFMPPLDEGTIMDMPVTVPRASVTEVADDLKARDALLRGFPEVESIIGKAGRADTPTDPAPLEMVETFVNFRLRDLWPKRVLRYEDAARQVREVARTLEERDLIYQAHHADDRDSLINAATQKALERFDETMRTFASTRYQEFEKELGTQLTRFAIAEIMQRFRRQGDLNALDCSEENGLIDGWTRRDSPSYGPWLARNPALEDVTKLCGEVANRLADLQKINDPVKALELKVPLWIAWLHQANELLSGEQKTFAKEINRAVSDQRLQLWKRQVEKINWELFDYGVGAFTWYALEEVAREARGKALIKGEKAEQLASAVLNEALAKPFKDRVFFWPRQGGKKGDLVADEMGRVLQVPGWSNIFTMPIINRIDMLSTGVRTDVGIKVFGPDLETIERISKEIEAVLKPLDGARDVLAAPFMNKGYLQIDIDREKAARYGITVEDIQNEIEVALGGRVITYTVEKRDRFPVRIRYARALREDEESVRRLLISRGQRSENGSQKSEVGSQMSEIRDKSSDFRSLTSIPGGKAVHQAGPQHGGKGKAAIPLSAVAEVRIVEGPAMIKGEKGRLMNYVTLNVRGRDSVGFVEEAQRVVAQKVPLPEGVSIEWAGEYEHQTRAARTLRFVLPAVVVLIFVILYLTYKDLADASLMMLALPEAWAGGAFFMVFFPKIMPDWGEVNFSVAIWVGFIACFGMATETGIIMLVYLRQAIDKRGGLENIRSLEELRQAVIEGAVHRLRPKLLTEGVAILAIFPMVFAKGIGGEFLAPLALPVLGGLLISDEVVDLFLPVRFYWVRRARWLKMHGVG